MSSRTKVPVSPEQNVSEARSSKDTGGTHRGHPAEVVLARSGSVICWCIQSDYGVYTPKGQDVALSFANLSSGRRRISILGRQNQERARTRVHPRRARDRTTNPRCLPARAASRPYESPSRSATWMAYVWPPSATSADSTARSHRADSPRLSILRRRNFGVALSSRKMVSSARRPSGFRCPSADVARAKCPKNPWPGRSRRPSPHRCACPLNSNSLVSWITRICFNAAARRAVCRICGLRIPSGVTFSLPKKR